MTSSASSKNAARRKPLTRPELALIAQVGLLLLFSSFAWFSFYDSPPEHPPTTLDRFHDMALLSLIALPCLVLNALYFVIHKKHATAAKWIVALSLILGIFVSILPTMAILFFNNFNPIKALLLPLGELLLGRYFGWGFAIASCSMIMLAIVHAYIFFGLTRGKYDAD